MKKINNTLTALIGIWFIIAPWIFGFSDHVAALSISVVIGAVQLITSLRSFKTPEWNFITFFVGVWFIIFPFVYTVDTTEIWTCTSVVLGAITVILTLWNE
ncbi:SPW repeat protein [Paenibacillus frigoriresistens]|uniref:SPW repeat protein n=1 Tax=Paenibacillus alginolyticus TaxID=59839 RepID=UPI0015633798|nr:SPW repeat protein [Paenibacillus frigoriresistens]NRF95900.1 SPW repeat protein [Paenibacillus frigoriresistens]